MKSRDYQQRAIDAAIADLGEANSSLIVMATGLGKTVTFSKIAKHYAQVGRVMVLAHREELIHQAADKIGRITGEAPDIEMADLWADRHVLLGGQAKIVASSVQTQISGQGGKGRMTRFHPSDFALLIIDEAHHAPADSYKKVIAHYRQNPGLKILGVTATPDRADEEALGQIFDRVSYVYEIGDGIGDGWLTPIMQQSVVVEGLDFSHVRTTAGDLNGADLASIMEYEENLHRIAHPTFELSKGRKTLLFAASVAHAERLCEIFNRHKTGCARFVCGTTDDVVRKQTLRDYREGRFQILCNVGVFTEGFDEPSIAVIAIARPTKSRALYTQMVGRGTRPLDGLVDQYATAPERCAAIAASAKPSLEVLDFVGNAGRHKLMTTADILGGAYPDEVVETATEMARKAKKAVDMRDILAQVAEELEEQQRKAEMERQSEAARRARLVGKAKYSTQIVNAFDLLDIQPERERGWDMGRPPSEKQIGLLQQFGIQNASELSARHASQLIGNLIERRRANMCSLKQANLLKKYGYPTDVTFADARKIIERLAANNWRRPAEDLSLVGATEGEL